MKLEDGLGAKWVGASDIDVCQGRGATEYLSFRSLRENLYYDESNAFFEDLVPCTKVIHERRPRQFADESFVFNSSDGILRVPKGIRNAARVLDKPGKMKAPMDIDELYDFSAVGTCHASLRRFVGDFLAEHTVPTDDRDLLDGLAVRMRSNCYDKWGDDKENWGCDLFNSYYSEKFWQKLDYRGFDMSNYTERNYENLYLGCRRRGSTNLWWQCIIAAAEPPGGSGTISYLQLANYPMEKRRYFEADGKYGNKNCDNTVGDYKKSVTQDMSECIGDASHLECNIVKVTSPLQQVNTENYDTAVSLIFGDAYLFLFCTNDTKLYDVHERDTW
eukprot:scaffold9085_cov215-Amphora_coffeaeformis.AAC.21